MINVKLYVSIHVCTTMWFLKVGNRKIAALPFVFNTIFHLNKQSFVMDVFVDSKVVFCF